MTFPRLVTKFFWKITDKHK